MPALLFISRDEQILAKASRRAARYTLEAYATMRPRVRNITGPKYSLSSRHSGPAPGGGRTFMLNVIAHTLNREDF
jgi:hypothetical protein